MRLPCSSARARAISNTVEKILTARSTIFGVSGSGEAERAALMGPIESETRMAQERGGGELR
jgi:hypothetical protein